MRRTFFQRLIATLCLAAFALGQVLIAPFGVRCTDAAGNTRIEFACIKSEQGTCLTPGVMPGVMPGVHAAEDSHESDPVLPTPCDDEPLGSHVSAAKVVPSSVSVKPVFPAIVVAILWDHRPVACDAPARVSRPARDRDHPPDSLARLRSVILIV